MVSNKTNKRTGVSRKLLAAVAVFAMVAAAFAFVGVAADDSVADAAAVTGGETAGTAAEISTPADLILTAAADNGSKKYFKLADGYTGNAAGDVTFAHDIVIDLNGKVLNCDTNGIIISDDATVEFTGKGEIVANKASAITLGNNSVLKIDGTSTTDCIKVNSTGTNVFDGNSATGETIYLDAADVSTEPTVMYGIDKAFVSNGTGTPFYQWVNFGNVADLVLGDGDIVTDVHTNNLASTSSVATKEVKINGKVMTYDGQATDYTSLTFSAYNGSEAAKLVLGTTAVKSGQTLVLDVNTVIADTVTVQNGGTLIIKAPYSFEGVGKILVPGTGVLKFENVTLKDKTFDYPVTLKNVTLEGKNTFNGVLTLEGTALDISKGARVFINDEVKGTITVNNEGTVYLGKDGSEVADIASTVTINNNGNVKIVDKAVVLGGNITGNTVDMSAIASEAGLEGELNKGTTGFGMYQTITATKDITLLDEAIYTFEGKFIIPEGVTVTIKDGAQIIMKDQFGVLENNGKIVIESKIANGGLYVNGGKVINNGTISATLAADGTAITVAENGVFVGAFENNGSVSLNSKSTMSVADVAIKNKTDATIVIDGTIDFNTSGSVENEGTITVNGTATVSSESQSIVKNKDSLVINGVFKGTVNLLNTDAVVDIKVLGPASNIIISDDGLMVGNTAATEANDTATIETDAYQTFGGIVVKAVTVKSGSNNVASLTVSGNAVVGKSAANNDVSSHPIANELTFANTIVVSDTFTVGAGLTVSTSSALTVSGEMKVLNAGVLENTGDITVTGTLTLVGSDVTGGGDVFAAKYSVTETVGSSPVTTTIYTTLDNALAAGKTPVTVKVNGDYTFEKDVTIPAQITVEFTDGVNVIIKDGATVVVANTGKLAVNAGETITVNGTLVLENSATGVSSPDAVISEVKSVEGTKVTYTSLVNALNNAVAGQTITIETYEPAVINRNASIKDGVTLQVDAAKSIRFANDVTFTIDGKLFFNDGTFTVDAASSPAKATVFVLNGLVENTDDMADDAVKYFAGAYYSTTENAKMAYFVAPVEKAVVDIAKYDDRTINVFGEVSVDNLALTGAADKAVTMILNDKFTAGTVTLDFATVDAKGAFTGTIANGAGSVVLKNVSAFTAVSTTADAVKTLTIAGTTTVGAAGSVVFNDAVTLNGFTASAATVEGTVKVAATSAIDTLVVNGTVDVAKNVALNTDNLTVFGTVNATEENASVDVDINMYIGVDAKALGLKADGSLAATAAANGKFTVTGITYAAPGATVPADIAKLGSVTYKVNGTDWVVAYAAVGKDIVELKAAVDNAMVKGWKGLPEDKKFTNKPIVLNAEIITDIYDVIVYADEGIGTVAIDGNVMANVMGNKFTLVGGFIAAGPHEITFKFKEGYDGKVVMTVDGKAADGLKFTASGTDGVKLDGDKVMANTQITYTLNLQGANPVEPIVPPTPVPPTPVPPAPVEPADDGLTVTDYLLIVLVVLIAIMTIMVAMKLMRS